MSNRKRNRRRNKFVIRYWWRGDIEDEKHWRFPTKEAAWAHVVGDIRKRAKRFDEREAENGYEPTRIDWEKLKEDLFGPSGFASCIYCRCDSWYDNWEFFRMP